MTKKMILTGFGVVLAVAAGWVLRGLFGGGGGGMPPMPGAGQMSAPPVAVVTIEEQSIQPVDEYIAVVEPVQDVMIRAEVSGSVAAVHFTEGGFVEAGDLLFTIDPRPYQAAVDAAKAERFRAKTLFDRMQASDQRSVSAADLDAAESDLLRAEANLKAAQVNLDFTRIHAPVSGRIGAALITKGNYVTPASGPLARIVQTDPIRVTFSMTDRDYLELRRNELSGEAGVREAAVRLPDGTVLSETGTKEFDDNAINPQTGTLAVRYLFDNPDGLLVPGGFVTALLQDAAEQTGIRIPQKAVLVDQQGAYVLTVDEENSVDAARIEPGEQLDADITVRSGLKPGDRIIVDGIQKAQPGATVKVMEE